MQQAKGRAKGEGQQQDQRDGSQPAVRNRLPRNVGGRLFRAVE